jgi:hypothetical protein
LPYRPWQAVYNVGFRVVLAAEPNQLPLAVSTSTNPKR